MGIKTDWNYANMVFEVVDAGLNFLCVDFMIRNYNYTAVVILHCLHEGLYFSGVASSPKQQRILIEGYFNECFKV